MPKTNFNPSQRQLDMIGTYLCWYVNWFEYIKYHKHKHKYVYLTLKKTWLHNLECLVTISKQFQSSYGKPEHLQITH